MGAFRTYNIAQELVDNGAQVTVITTKNYSFLPKQVLPIHSGINVKRITSFDYNFIKGLIFKNKTKNTSNTATSKTSYSLAFRILDTFPVNIIIGLGGALYILLSLLYTLPRIRKYTHVFSSFRPYSDHFIAYILKTIRPSLFWIADFRDIHVDKKNVNVASISYQEFINRNIFKHSDALVTVSEGYLNSLRHYNSSHHIIPNGISDSLIERFASIESSKPKIFTISHVGSLYGGRRDPSFLFEVISDLISNGKLTTEQIQLQYAGSDGDLWMSYLKNFGLEDSGVDLGSVDHNTAIKIQKSSHINLMITWATKSGGTFPAKFFEYLVAKKPILLLVNGERDLEFEKIFNEHEIGLLSYTSPEFQLVLKEFILSCMSTSEKFTDPNIIAKYHWKKLIKKFQLLDADSLAH